MKSDEMWREFASFSGVEENYSQWAFCGGGKEADELLSLVKEGKKRATASALIAYETEKEPIPENGAYSVVLDSKGEAGVIVRNRKVTLTPFSLVHPYHAFLEGEGDRSLSYWRKVHEEFFSPDYRNAGLSFDSDGICVLEEFDTLWPTEHKDKEEIYLTLPEAEEWREIEEYREDTRKGGTLDGMGSLARCKDIRKWAEEEKRMCFPQFVPQDLVPDTVLFARSHEDNRIVGMVSIRHSLNQYLRKYGGNIGYSVRPGERRKGYGKEILRLTLPYMKALGMERALITTDKGNTASRNIILGAGGKFEGESDGIQRYWIDLPQ